MTSRRLLKAAEAIREVVATAILTEIRDPRVKDVTVISVDVTPDMREAKVSVSVMGDEPQKQLSLRGLQNAAGFLQSKIARRIDTRYTPKLQFELNRGTENAAVVGELLNRIRREKEDSDASAHDASDGVDGDNGESIGQPERQAIDQEHDSEVQRQPDSRRDDPGFSTEADSRDPMSESS